MEIEKLASKLEPLMGSEVRRWMRVREIGDPELRNLIEKQIVSVAHKKLGDFRKKIFLSLPPKKRAKGTFDLGTVLYEKEKWPAGINDSELLQNLAIFGRSGAGKTNCLFHLLLQIVNKKIPFVFFDWKRTGRHLLPLLKHRVNVYTPGRSLSRLPFNPLIVPPGLEQNVYINQFIDVMADAFTLGDGAKSVLQKALAARYSESTDKPSISEILEEVRSMPDKDRMRGWKISLERALNSLLFSKVHSEISGSQSQLIRDLMEQNTVIELNGLDQSSKKFLIPMLSLWIYFAALGASERETLKFVIILEEAHHTLYGSRGRARETVMEMILRQCREIGIGVIVVDQHPHLISKAVTGNCYTSICFNLKDPSDVVRAGELSLVGRDERNYFSMLPVGHAIVKLQDRWVKPFVVKVPHVEIEKGFVTDKRLRRYLSRRTGSSGKRSLRVEFGGVRGFRFKDDILESSELSFIEDVISHKYDGVKERYKRLGWSVDRGNRVKNELVGAGWLDAEMMRIGRTRKLLLRVSKNGKKHLGIVDGRAHESLAHEYWKSHYAERYRKMGFNIGVEADLSGYKVDVLAQKGNEDIGIEIETGKSDVVMNVQKCLKSGVKRVLVVAVDKKALAKVEKDLSAVGLIIPGRVDIVVGANKAWDL